MDPNIGLANPPPTILDDLEGYDEPKKGRVPTPPPIVVTAKDVNSLEVVLWWGLAAITLIVCWVLVKGGAQGLWYIITCDKDWYTM